MASEPPINKPGGDASLTFSLKKAATSIRTRRKLVLAGIVAIAVLLIAYGVFRLPGININSIDEIKALTERDRIIIFAPHCDDETLGSGGIIQKALDKNIPVKVVMITNGDDNIFTTDIQFTTIFPSAAEFIAAGEKRQQESIDALVSLGVKREDIIFLSFPDKGLREMFTTNWSNAMPFTSDGTREAMSVYKITYEPGVVYSGEKLLGNLKSIIADFNPTIVIAPHEKDHHPDHKYAFKFIVKALKELYGGTSGKEPPVILTYLVHYPHYPVPRGLKRGRSLLPPLSSSFEMMWFQLPLGKDEQDRKYEAIRLYRSQLKLPELRKLMYSFARENELFEQVDFLDALTMLDEAEK